MVRWSVDGLPFSSTYWYDIDLQALEQEWGRRWRRIVFHIGLFELSRGISLGPTRLDLGAWSDLYTESLDRVWRRIVHGVWAQWRYMHDRPNHPVPVPDAAPTRDRSEPMVRNLGQDRFLAFCGGGKDSLVVLDLLERIGVTHGALVYSSSEYGRSDHQRQLVDALAAHSAADPVHHQTHLDDFSNSPVLEAHPEFDVRALIAAETPTSLMAALPLGLAGGYTHFVLGHERSANSGNLVWDKTGEDVNHQWGKSVVAERLLTQYIQSELVADIGYFSLLQAVHDPLIFAALMRRLDAVADTHSCNVRKPWCMQCAKCAYVWLGYKAWLPDSIVDPIFGGSNLADNPANDLWFAQLLGLADQTPFECVGQVEEARLFMALARARGLRGRAVTMFEATVLASGWTPVVGDLLRPHAGGFGGPAALLEPLMGELRDVAAWAWQHLEDTLGVERAALEPRRVATAG